MEAQWSPQWSLNGRYRLAKGGTMVVQRRQKLRSNWDAMFTTVRICLRGDQWPTLCIHSATTAMRVPHPASFERPVSDRHPRRLCATVWAWCSKLHGDHGVHGEVWTSSVPPTIERLMANFQPPMCLQRQPGKLCSRTGEAQRSQPLCKGVKQINGQPIFIQNSLVVGFNNVISRLCNMIIVTPRDNMAVSDALVPWYPFPSPRASNAGNSVLERMH